MSCNEKISVKDVVIPELPFRGDISIFEDVNIDLFTDEPLLEEAYNMEKIFILASVRHPFAILFILFILAFVYLEHL